MLLRNLDLTNGYCSGTRYIIQPLHQHVIDAVIACGPHAGKRIFISRINVFPLHMKRKQFPLGPAFAMTSSKAQGQTLQKIEISLQHPSFFVCRQEQVHIFRTGRRRDLPLDKSNEFSGDVDKGIVAADNAEMEFLDTLHTYRTLYGP
ncbi:hypothetical protein RRG08_009537 [Elysia crispata]|uniref:Uncharacterized protein n=1 Tax=Elysia crispata TaxID=231223 RepID=A0AAE1B208_9GAST|nr:hypothetical protein RRG08_009537 [Elysia crispata]